MEKTYSISFGDNDGEIRRVGVVNENGKRGIKFIFRNGDYEREQVLFVGDECTYHYSYVEITGPTDWDDEDNYIYLRLIEK